MRGLAAALALCALLCPAAVFGAQGAGGMTQDLLDALTKSPAARQDRSAAPRPGAGPTAPAQPAAPVVPGASVPSVTFPSGAQPLRPAGRPGANQGRHRVLTLRHDGLDRRALVTLPKTAAVKKGQLAPKLPVIIFLHGAGGSALQAMRQTNLAERAAAAGFAAVFADGTGAPGAEAEGLAWNAWDCCGYARDRRVDDVGFLSQLIGRLRTDYGADPARIYLAGFSNGAELASRFALERPGVVAAIASVGGSMACDAPRPSEALPVLVIHGARDVMARYNPTPAHPATGKLCEDHQAQAQVEHWVRGMNLPRAPRVREDAAVRVEDYAPAQAQGGHGFLRFVLVKAGGHAWPGGASEVYRYCVLPTRRPDATALVLDFFSHPPRAAAPAPAKKQAKVRKSAR
jgi:polyhydroxybutyrate depolymerase